MKALLVVDIHNSWGWAKRTIESCETDRLVVLAIKSELEKARAAGDIVIFIMFPNGCNGQEFQISKNGKCIGCDTPDSLPEFFEHRHECEPVFFKNRCNAFTNHNLAEYLRSKDVADIILTGCATFVCVFDTAKGALKNGFDVTLLADCVSPPFQTDEWADAKKWLASVQNYAEPTNNNVATVCNIKGVTE